MPTGVAIRDPRGQLFGAAERVLLRDGPSGLTSRSVAAMIARSACDFWSRPFTSRARIVGAMDGQWLVDRENSLARVLADARH